MSSWHLLTASQIPCFFFSEILFQFIHGYAVLKLTPLSVGNAKAEGMHCIFPEETNKNPRTSPGDWSASCGLWEKTYA